MGVESEAGGLKEGSLRFYNAGIGLGGTDIGVRAIKRRMRGCKARRWIGGGKGLAEAASAGQGEAAGAPASASRLSKRTRRKKSNGGKKNRRLKRGLPFHLSGGKGAPAACGDLSELDEPNSKRREPQSGGGSGVGEKEREKAGAPSRLVRLHVEERSG